jgi:putative phosphoesterase
MKIGALSDAHGNVEAFEKGLAILNRLGADQMVFLGDAVGYFAGAEVISSLMHRSLSVIIRGNHDEMLLSGDVSADRERVYRLERVRQVLTSSERDFVSAWPLRQKMTIGERSFLFVHGAPNDELWGYLYTDTPLDALDDGVQEQIVFIGQTHRPFIRVAGLTTYINVGSCGLPRDHGAMGSLALYDTENGEAQIVRYSIEDETRHALARGEVDDGVLRVIERRAPYFGDNYEL